MTKLLRSSALTFMLLGSLSCNSKPHSHGGAAHSHSAPEAPSHGGHGHAHSPDAIGITRFTDKLELFAEHPPAISGKELTFLAHLTILDGFEALEQATVTLILDGPQRVEAKVTKMLRSGIFQPTTTAPKPGTYQAQLVVSGPQATDIIGGFEIVVYASAEAAKNASQSEESEGPEPISFLKEQQWQVPFATTFAVSDSLIPTINVAGEVDTPPSGQAYVTAAIAGRIVAPAKGLPRPGQAVTRGQVLASIAPAPTAPEDSARADLAVVEAEARLQSAKAAQSRAERLIKDRAISQHDVEQARRELGVSTEAVQAARRAQRVYVEAASGRGAGSYRVTAPIDGVVAKVQATQGKFVASGTDLLHIVNLSELWIRGRVPEQDAARLRADQDAAYRLPGLQSWLPIRLTGSQPNASLVNISRVVDARSRTVDVIYALQLPDERLRVGAMVRVAVPAGPPWQGVVIPTSAVLDSDGVSTVYVQVEGEAFEARTVRLGPKSGSKVGILRGVQAQERVVTRGANLIRLASRSATAPSHGHVH